MRHSVRHRFFQNGSGVFACAIFLSAATSLSAMQLVAPEAGFGPRSAETDSGEAPAAAPEREPFLRDPMLFPPMENASRIRHLRREALELFAEFNGFDGPGPDLAQRTRASKLHRALTDLGASDCEEMERLDFLIRWREITGPGCGSEQPISDSQADLICRTDFVRSSTRALIAGGDRPVCLIGDDIVAEGERHQRYDHLTIARIDSEAVVIEVREGPSDPAEPGRIAIQVNPFESAGFWR